MDDPANRETGCEEIAGCRTPAHIAVSPSSPSESQPRDQETKPLLNKTKTKSRIKSSSRYMFLDSSLSDEEQVDDKEKTVNGVVLFGNNKQNGYQSEKSVNRGSDHMVADEVSSLIPQSIISENSWTCPLSLDRLSSSDTETEESSSSQPVGQTPEPVKSSVRSKNCSGVILKLRKMFTEGLQRKKVCYQAVSESESFTDVSLSQTDDVQGEVSCEKNLQRGTAKATHRWQRTGSLSHTLQPPSNSSKRQRRSLLKIKYCPYLSACHSAEHRRRWVLRSAVQRARRAMRFYYPDLVGKKIYHLYEEDDKSEVWYKGEVLRIHEAHRNPLKTIFEVRYDSEPEWKYYLELLIDYKKGWLKIDD